MKNVLILNGGTTTGILIARCLNMSVLYHAMSASSYREHSRFTFEDYYPGLPFVQEENFVEELNKLLDEKKIDFIIPTHDTIALVLMEKADEIHATIISSPLETTLLCRYKSKTYERLAGCAFTPFWGMLTKESRFTEFPLFLKPDDGQGGRGTLKVHNEQELAAALEKGSNYVVCEYLPGEEYTVDCFTKASGELIYVNPRKRAEIMDGKSSLAESVVGKETAEFEKIAEEINTRIPFRGYWFIQLKRDGKGNLKLLEICTRFAGTFAHAQASGINLPLLALSDFSGKDVCALKNDYKVTTGKAFIDRYLLDLSYERVYIDYDDTVTCEGGTKVNSFVMAWLYQCKNAGKELVLISRHTATKANTLAEDMARLQIPATLFSKIYDIDEKTGKEEYIESENSIFMDNSFAERKRVADKLGIPVFDVSHVDCLYDWRKL